ncbi:anti-sigma-I factor RsgI family protein [Paenibacillus sinopodophylli]|uniref:anti-sigma-I factor RsgI family protein n=1 Tax=Paenibacillus sinopodophylli TaxID=1837342 RepID=UPI00110CB6B9|nr:anti-sigma factor domain-containing protein [Paenibacillus sinopodophylli]
MKRGVVVSIHKQHAVVMTADGQFLQAPIQEAMQLGEEIIFEAEYKKSRTVKPVYWYGSAAALLLVLFLPLLFFIERDANPVVAYVSMDINPSVELGVDENEKVRELRALNPDGEHIIKGLQYDGVNVEMVAASILEKAKTSHYLDTPNKDIFITSVLLGDDSALKLDYESILTGKVDETLRLLLSTLTEEAASATITTMSIPNEVREEAAVNGISSGKMAVYLMAKEEGYQLELEQLRQQSIDKVTASVGGLKTIVDNAQDTSKEKLKELVAKEQEEKANQQKNENKPSTARPASTPNTNKPVKAEKPVKPVGSVTIKPAETKKPAENSTRGNKPVTTPNKSNKPSKPDRPNAGKQDDNKKDDEQDRGDRWDQGRNDDRGQNRNDNRGNYDRGSGWRKDNDNDRSEERNGRSADHNDDKETNGRNENRKNTSNKDDNKR